MRAATGRSGRNARLFEGLGDIELTLLVGQYTQAYYLGKRRKRTLTETVAAWREYLPNHFPMPHPSWRTIAWQRKNPWFDTELRPALLECVHALVKPG